MSRHRPARDKQFGRGRAVTVCPVTGKQAYTSRKQARRARQWCGDLLRPYRCEHCPWWHLGHIPRDVANGALDRAVYRAQKEAGR